MSEHSIVITFDDTMVGGYTDERLATLWHVAQANPAPFADPVAGELVERLGREIIRRWLRGVEPSLWHHQGRHYSRHWLRTFARYEPGGPAGTPEWRRGRWVLKGDPPAPREADEAEGGAS
jgi:hypothetical protein